MVLVISQETFNAAVQENIEDLGLSPEEAVREAVVQFESQGVDLSTIMKELALEPKSFGEVEECLKQLNTLSKSKAPPAKIIEQLNALKEQCEKGIQYKVFAGQHGAYTLLLDIFTNHNDLDLKRYCVKTLVSLMSKQPDLLDHRGIEIIISLLEKDEDIELKRLTLRWTKECCILHEKNRQDIFNANILERLKAMLHEGTTDLLREVMAVCRALVLDDDVRVEFGKSHEHARVIASECLCLLTGLFSRLKDDETLLSELIQTICVLMVRTEFCKKVSDAGGLELIAEAMKNSGKSQKVVKQCFKLLKALAGNDHCKTVMLQRDLAPLIVAALQQNKSYTQVVTAGLSSVAAICLRCPDNSTILFQANIPEVIVDIMKSHPNDKQIQRTGSWAIRNMVSRSQYQCQTFINLGIEDLLHSNLKKFKDIEYDTKSALRDLGCKVDLKEEWTGKGGALNTTSSGKK
ncbi:hypothetical protein NQ315_009323 [Exocentrus adspersus]|uniref:Armadillo repeat-containing protein 6 n=1 Tax=Exocentrus adspersus TaxID=1586481 RepID=A0AAV8WH76_9CUCU|nr:hypothetical protein NQ315_009323 [Exocentrus adspersus]